MGTDKALVITTISAPNKVMRKLSAGAIKNGYNFIIAGDTKSPENFFLEGVQFLSIKDQIDSGFSYALKCPTRHYCRKNIGYLTAIREGAKIIVETDDDNFPRAEFFAQRRRHIKVRTIFRNGWVNIYRYFSDANIWPRGFPLDEINHELLSLDKFPIIEVDCPIQQGLADENPDVDAIYRLLMPLPHNFTTAKSIALGNETWCPFNSQNTTWWADTFPLLYLPAYCSFRMTDIWRSFVAQRIAWENNWSVVFHEPTVWQERNEHNLMQDFNDEIPGYLYNRRIGEALGKISLTPGEEAIPDNLRKCYEMMVEMEFVVRKELSLLDSWLTDLEQLR